MLVMKVIFLKIGLIRYFVILEDRLRYKDFDFTSPTSFPLISKKKEMVTCYLILCYYLSLMFFFLYCMRKYICVSA